MKSTRSARLRRTVALLAVIAAALVFMVRLVDVQVVSAAQLNEDARGKRAVAVAIPSVRGDIVDRNGNTLATTDERYDVQLSPKNTAINGGKFWRPEENGGISTVEVTSYEAFGEIGAITGQSADEIQKIVDDALAENPESDFAYVKRSVDLTTLNRLKKLGIPWLTFESQHARTYPNGAVGGNLIGFTGSEGEAQAGVELSQNTCLSGTDGFETYERGADQVPLPGSAVIEKRAVNGGTVELTIDRDLQWEAQQALNAQVQRVDAEWGYLIIMDVKTGELLAVAEDGSVDPNDVDASDPARRTARAFTYPYEPGSTFKTITAAALIDQGVATPNTHNLTPDYLEPEAGVRFGDSFSHEPMPWTLTGILVQSSNVGTATLGTKLDAKTRYDYLRKFGIGTPTDAGWGEEEGGMLIPVENWDRQTNYNTTFGQAVSSTIVQTASVYQAIANGGVRVPPVLVKSCTDADGTVHTLEHGKESRVVKKSTADSVMHILGTVVSDGWFKSMIDVPGYRLAGKTGTAEQVDPETGLYRSDYVNSFAGVYPADDPQYVAVTSIAFAHSGPGNEAAVKVFHDAVEATVRTFHVPPISEEFDPLPTEY